MNVKQLAQNVGWWIRIRPEARGLLLRDLEWSIESVDEGRKMARLSLPATGHFVELEGDHIHSFMKDPKRRGPNRNYGFLILRVELTIDGYQIHGEPLPPNSPGVSMWRTEDKVVDERYIDRAGLRQRYRTLRWSNEENVAAGEADGYRIVYEEDLVRRTQYRLVRRGQVLVGRR